MMFQGPRWEDGAFVEGWVEVEGGAIVSVGRGDAPRRVEARGVLVPSFVDAHTHVGDRIARGRIPDGISLEDLVAPPHGLKHRLLAEATPEALLDGMRACLAEAHASGTGVLYDFREGGPQGAAALVEASRGASTRAVVLGRPAEALAHADGLGLSALRDAGVDESRRQRDAARAAGKRFALHWSEAEREPVDAMLDLAPDFAVHATRAAAADLARVADARVPLVACPRSNARLLHAMPDVRAWLDAGIDACLGTDNAMLQTVDMLDEMRFLREKAQDLSREDILEMAVDAPRRRLAPPGAMRAWAPGERADFVVMEPRGASPFDALFSPSARVLRWG